jgi:hypothetical protein
MSKRLRTESFVEALDDSRLDRMEENQDQGLRIASEPDPETEGEAAAERVSAVFKKALESAPLARRETACARHESAAK